MEQLEQEYSTLANRTGIFSSPPVGLRLRSGIN